MSDLVQISTSPLRGGAIELNVESIDVYLTFKCGMRCSHCFVGDNLSSNADMTLESLHRLLRTAHSWKTRQVTFLGGEPTMHPNFDQALSMAASEGYATRIVTNGHLSYARFLRRRVPPGFLVCFSVDGATAEVHDRIRGIGTYEVLLNNVKASISARYRVAGIISLSKQNVSQIGDILQLCDDLGFEYVNVHYVTNRGFARREIVLSVQEWATTYAQIRSISKKLKNTEVRVEKTFEESSAIHFRCAVKEKSNLMFLPDGRVFMCMMFIGSPLAHSYVWNGYELLRNAELRNEQRLVLFGDDPGCRGIRQFNPTLSDCARAVGSTVQCIYEKEHLIPGGVG
jgi:MoaA/NifB/PqqE/SkfB family radical SAM enzyme